MTKDIELALSKGKVKGAKALLQEYYKQEHYNSWLADKQAEYDELYQYEIIVPKQIAMLEDGTEELVAESYNKLVYQEDCPTFTDWLNETTVVQEAIYEDDTLVTPEVTEPVRPYVANDVTDKVEAYLTTTDFSKKQALEYLASTDWMVVRFAETGVAIPDDVISKRAEARLNAK